MRLNVPIGPDDHVEGGEQWKVTLLEYGDFECPACGQAYPIVKAVRQQLGPALRFVFRHFPLKDVHPHAEAAAWLAEAAAPGGGFWALHDLLYEHQDPLDPASLRRYGAAIGLDAAQIDAALGGAPRARVDADIDGGVRSGVNGTPAFFIDGERFDGYWDANGLLRALRAAGA